MSNINEFIGHVKKYGIASKNKFDVSIPLPLSVMQKIQAVGNGSIINDLDPTGLVRTATDLLGVTDGRGPAALGRQLNLMCVGAYMPGFNIITLDGTWNGHKYQVAKAANSEPIEFLFLVSGDGVEQTIFEAWRDQIVRFDTGRVGYYDDYTTDTVRVSQRDESGNRQHYVDVIEAYPITVNSVDFDKTGDIQRHLLSVTFTFKRIRPKGSVSLMETIRDSKAGQIVDSLASGDITTAAQKAAEVVEGVAAGQYVGEALGSYEIVKSATDLIGVNPNEAKKLLNTSRGDIAVNNRISEPDKTSLTGMIDTITDLI